MIIFYENIETEKKKTLYIYSYTLFINNFVLFHFDLKIFLNGDLLFIEDSKLFFN